MIDGEVSDVCTGVVEYVAARSRAHLFWRNSPIAKVRSLEIDERGRVGELILVRLLRAIGRHVEHDETTSMDKDWDFVCDLLRWESKLATATTPKGGGAITFQHEGIDKTRHWHGLAMLDLAPQALYLTLRPRKWIQWSKLHHRRSASFYKLDTTLSMRASTTLYVGGNELTSLERFEAIWAQGESEVREAEAGVPRPKGYGEDTPQEVLL